MGDVTEPNDILNSLVNMYQKLFMTKGTTNTYTLTKLPGSKLSEEDNMYCEKPITPTVVVNTIKGLFMNMLFEVFKKGELSESQKLGVV